MPLVRHASRVLVAAVSLIAAMTVSAALASAQYFGRVRIEPNATYDGRFTFVRLRYQLVTRPGWEYDYPAMERNFMTIANDLTTLRPHTAESNILDMDDPELSRYPIAYLSEPGYWYPSPTEARGLRTWLKKGGFLVVDDFLLNQWAQFEYAMKQVLPDAKIVPLTIKHPIFDAFFRITTLSGMHHPDNSRAIAEYYGIYENNDPTRRLMVIINYNNDIGDYMEWSGQGWYAVNLSNDAYKMATNWIVYGLTH
ncbi:MAG: DUF4159 domain-containing protein [Gemmatimonadota bacterium]